MNRHEGTEAGRHEGKCEGSLPPLLPRRAFLPTCLRAFFLFLLLSSLARASDPNLHVLRSDHYRIYTDLDAALADDLSRRMDAMYDEYSRRLVDFHGGGEEKQFDVYLFNRRIDYMKFTDNRFPNTAGLFISGRDVLAAFLEGQGRDALRRTLQHEAFHQFA